MSNTTKVSSLLLLILGLAWCTACDGPKYAHGQRSYENHCADCHMDDGMGVADLYPTLISKTVIDSYETIPCIIRKGLNKPTSLLKMPGIPKMRAVDITNILNYILHDLNKVEKTVLLKEVDVMLKGCNE